MDVKAAREGVGWSQVRLAEWVGVSQPTVARWESGGAVPDAAQLAAIGGLAQRFASVVRLDPYPSAPAGGAAGSREAEERLAWVRARNRAFQAGVGG